LATHHTALDAAMDLVENNLVKIGPRLVYGFKDHNDVQSLVEHLPFWLTQCSGNLANCREHDCDVRGASRQASARLPSAFELAWHQVDKLGELVSCALGDQLPKLSTPEPQTISNRQAAQLYADLTTTKPDPSNIGKVIGNGRLANEAVALPSPTKTKKTAAKSVRKEVELRGLASIVSDAISEQEMDDTGRTLSDILRSCEVSYDTFRNSPHFKTARADWDRLDSAREARKEDFRDRHSEHHSEQADLT